jgi:hypothetical protein
MASLKTSFHYYRARYYDPQAGRFLNEDPSGFIGGINKYRFVRNSPLNWTDRFGTSENECDCPETNNNKMPLRRRLGLAFSGIANVVGGGAGMGLALGAETGTVGMATPLAAYVAVQGAGYFVQGITEVLVAVTGDNAGEALVEDASNATSHLSISGLVFGALPPRNPALGATARGVEGLVTTTVFEPERLPLQVLEAAHAAQEAMGLKCAAH